MEWGMGKEAMIRLLGRDALEVSRMALEIGAMMKRPLAGKQQSI